MRRLEPHAVTMGGNKLVHCLMEGCGKELALMSSGKALTSEVTNHHRTTHVKNLNSKEECGTKRAKKLL